MVCQPTDEITHRLTATCGYQWRESGGVGMFAVSNLPKLLTEMTPLLEKRLADIDWSGTIALCGQRHRAAVRISRGRVQALAKLPRRADITLAGSDDTITSILLAGQTPFEAYLQTDLSITPMLNERTSAMLEALLPKAEGFGWFR